MVILYPEATTTCSN